MLIFIDDSGDPGFKLDKGSTSHFVIATVIFEDELEAEKAAIAIKELKRELKFSPRDEFRFFKTCPDYRKKFLQRIKTYNYRIRALVVDKSKIYSRELKDNKNSFYAYFIKEVLKKSKNVKEAKIRIDGGGDRFFRRNFITYLRRELNSQEKKTMKNCKMVDSKGNVLVQMADMIAGSINRSYSDKSDAKEYRKIIQNNLEDVWEFK